MNLYALILLAQMLPIILNNSVGSFWHVTPSNMTKETFCDMCVPDMFSKLTLASQNLKPDFILWTGVNYSNVHLTMEELSTRLLVNMTVLPALAPQELPGGNTTSMYKNVSSVSSYWLKGFELRTFLQNGYYSVILKKANMLRIVVLNTAFFSEFHVHSVGVIPVQQWAWLTNELQIARNKKQKVYLVMSAYAGHFVKPMEGQFADKHNKKFLLLIQDYKDVIVSQFGGWIGLDRIKVFEDNKGTIISYLLCNPAFLPYIRIYLYDTYTFKILDYVQYYWKRGRWLVHYRFSTYYGLPDISVPSMQIFATRLLDDEYFARHATRIGLNHYNRSYLCETIKTDHDDFLNCLIQKTRERTVKSLSYMSAIPSFIYIFPYVICLCNV